MASRLVLCNGEELMEVGNLKYFLNYFRWPLNHYTRMVSSGVFPQQKQHSQCRTIHVFGTTQIDSIFNTRS